MLAHPDDDGTGIQYLLPALGGKAKMRFAEIGFSGEVLLCHQSVPAAAVPAEIQYGAGPAIIRQMIGCLDEFLGFGTVEHLVKSVCMYIAKFPSVSHIEVAGINAAVAFHYELDGAASIHAAGFGPLAQQDTDPVVDMPYADIVALLQIFIP